MKWILLILAVVLIFPAMPDRVQEAGIAAGIGGGLFAGAIALIVVVVRKLWLAFGPKPRVIKRTSVILETRKGRSES